MEGFVRALSREVLKQTLDVIPEKRIVSIETTN